MGDLICISHRGAAGYEPENTLAGIEKALQLKVDMIEIDVRLSKDKKLILMHDETLNRTTNSKGKVNSKTYSELKKLDAGNRQKIPLLEEAIKLAKGKAILNIEVKTKDTVNPLLELLSKHGYLDKVTISSMLPEVIQDIKKQNPNIKTGLIAEKLDNNMIKLAKKIHADAIGVNYASIKENMVKKAKENNLMVFVWTVNEPEDIIKMKEMGVDGIVCDKPGLV